MEEKIINAYKEMLISKEAEINSFTIAKKVDITEREFFQYFSSADDIGRKIWSNLGEAVTDELNSSELFREYSPRQKVLFYFFTFFEVALNERTFIERTLSQSHLLSAYKEHFKHFMADIIQEGIAKEDIKERLSLSNYYPNMLWELHLQLIRFWLRDVSENFVETEKAIEIYCKVPLEVMGQNIFDHLFETLKFNIDQLKLERIIK